MTKDGEEVDLDVEQAKLPSQSLAQLEAQYANTETALEENEKKLVALSETDIPSLKEALKQVQTEIEFSKVVLSTEQTAGDKLMLLEGMGPCHQQGRDRGLSERCTYLLCRSQIRHRKTTCRSN